VQIPRHIYGVDFSGAKDAGKKIWIAKGVVEHEMLMIVDCFRASDLQNSGKGLDKCLPALLDLIEQEKDSVFGLDFPFGLPKNLVEQTNWEDFIRSFPSRYTSPEELKNKCISKAVQITSGQNKELKRKTDIETKTPFSPYNLRIFKQTYYGITKILNPLCRKRLATVLPMQNPSDDKPWVLEICPASTLQALGLYYPYKGNKEHHRIARFNVLVELEKDDKLKILGARLCRKIIEDPGGDALDSVIAAKAAFCAIKKKTPSPEDIKGEYGLEGYVYV